MQGVRERREFQARNKRQAADEDNQEEIVYSVLFKCEGYLTLPP